MRITITSLAAVLALSTAGCGRNDEPVTTDTNLDVASNDSMDMNAGANAAATAMPTDAAGFANAVAASDMFEIESAKLAAAQASSADIKSFAETLQRDHTKSTADLKAAAKESGLTITPALDPEKEAMLSSLRSANGADFDRMFVDQQTTAHQKALELLQNYSNAGDNAALKAFATKATTVVQGHLEHVNGMKR